jgi:hypothetical protein
MIKQMFAGLVLAAASLAAMSATPAAAQERGVSRQECWDRGGEVVVTRDGERCHISRETSSRSSRREQSEDPRAAECRQFVAEAYNSSMTTGIRNGVIMGAGGALANRQYGYVNHGEGDRAAAISGLAYGIVSGFQQRDTRQAAFAQCMAYATPSEYRAAVAGGTAPPMR